MSENQNAFDDCKEVVSGPPRRRRSEDALSPARRSVVDLSVAEKIKALMLEYGYTRATFEYSAPPDYVKAELKEPSFFLVVMEGREVFRGDESVKWCRAIEDLDGLAWELLVELRPDLLERGNTGFGIMVLQMDKDLHEGPLMRGSVFHKTQTAVEDQIDFKV